MEGTGLELRVANSLSSALWLPLICNSYGRVWYFWTESKHILVCSPSLILPGDWILHVRGWGRGSLVSQRNAVRACRQWPLGAGVQDDRTNPLEVPAPVQGKPATWPLFAFSRLSKALSPKTIWWHPTRSHEPVTKARWLRCCRLGDQRAAIGIINWYLLFPLWVCFLCKLPQY